MKLGRGFSKISILNNNLIEVGASCFNKSLVNFAMQNNCGGLEFLSGIPGSIGGGIAMNAGAYGRDFSNIIDSVTAILRSGKIITLSNKDFKFAINFLESKGIESRPLIAGNLINHPAGIKNKLKSANEKLHGANYHHKKSLYVGLTPFHSEEDIKRLIKTFEELDLKLLNN